MEKAWALLALSLLLLLSAAFTIGLTYAPCFASMCPEEFFPYATRIHIAVYYGMVASIGVALLLRAYIPWVHTVSTTYLVQRELPVLRKRISVGGLTLAVWIVALTVATTASWLNAESAFWSLRTDALHWPAAHLQLAITGIVGHHCDILLGLVVIPVSRNSILGRAFSLHQSTLLYAHKLLAYLFLIVVIAHGGAYYVRRGRMSLAPKSSLLTACTTGIRSHIRSNQGRHQRTKRSLQHRQSNSNDTAIGSSIDILAVRRTGVRDAGFRLHVAHYHYGPACSSKKELQHVLLYPSDWQCPCLVPG